MEGTRLVDDVLDWKSGGNEKGRECRRDLAGPRADEVEAVLEAELETTVEAGG